MTTLGSGPSTGELSPLPYAEPPAPEDEDVWEELPGRPLRKKLGPFSIVLCACLLAGGFFYAGVRVEKGKVGSSSGGASAASIIAALAARAGAGATATTAGGAATGRAGAATSTSSGAGSGAAGAAGAAGAFGGTAAGIRGTIVLIDGANVYIRETDQTVVKVATNGGTTISVTSPGTVANLHPGDTVRVTGPTGSDGTIAATAVTDSGAAAGGGGFGGGATAAGGAATTGGATGGATGATGGATGGAARTAGG